MDQSSDRDRFLPAEDCLELYITLVGVVVSMVPRGLQAETC